MDDVIYRQAAIDRFEPWLKVKGYNEGELNMLKAVLYELKCLPSAEPTLYGYNIEHLGMIASVLQKEDLPPERLSEILTDIGRIVAMVKDEFEESLRKAVEQCTI